MATRNGYSYRRHSVPDKFWKCRRRNQSSDGPRSRRVASLELIDQFDDYWVLEEALTREDGTRNGEILRTIPTAGMELAEGEILTYFVSLGPELRNIPLGFAGLTIDEAESML